MAELNTPASSSTFVPSHRLDVPVHQLLNQPAPRNGVDPAPQGRLFPEPVFPQHPELLHDVDEADIAAHETVRQTGKRNWSTPEILENMRGWLFPYVKSRVRAGDFHPIIAYLFTEWKCNLDCHYCWAFDNQRQGHDRGRRRARPSTGCTTRPAACSR